MNTKNSLETKPLQELQHLVNLAKRGIANDIDLIMNCLDEKVDFLLTRNVDYALSLVCSKEGVRRIRFYLFKGNIIQRNYACLYFVRRGERRVVKRAYRKGLVDEKQAFSR